MDLILPFKIGDLAEARSFIKGYRGAWFRCKVIDMCVRTTGHLECYLDYIDYPADKNKWTRVFQKNPALGKQKSNACREIMLRPSFPHWYQGDQVPEHFPKSNPISCVCDTWKVGDLVDWFCEGCYWTGNITRLLSEDKVKIELLKPPRGEGLCYDADCKDLRPALDWFLEKGWTAPLSQANGNRWYTVRLIHHKSEKSSSDEETGTDDDREELQKSLKRTSNKTQEATDDGREEVRKSLKRTSTMHQEATDDDREEVRKSLERTSIMDQEATDNDREEVRKSLERTSNMNQEAPGSSNLEVSSDTNSISCQNNQTNTIVTTMGVSSPSSISELSNPCHGAQAVVASSQPGTQCSSKQQASPTERLSVLSPESVKDAIAKLDGISNRIRDTRYLLQSAWAP